MTSSHKLLAVDVGGTKIAAAITDLSGNTLETSQFPTPQSGTAKGWFSDVARHLQSFIAETGHEPDVEGVYFATVGPMEAVGERVFLKPPNIEPLRKVAGGVAYPEELARLLGLPFGFDNDGNTAIAAEVLDPSGAAYGRDKVALLLWSSGVGCGFYVDGQLLHFTQRDPTTWADPSLSLVEKNSFEIGHAVVETDSAKALQCGDKAWGHLEGHLGGRAAEGRNEVPAESHPRLMDAGLNYLPMSLGPQLKEYGIDLVVISGSAGKALLRDNPNFSFALMSAFRRVTDGVDVLFVPAAIDNASLRGAQLLGVQSLRLNLLAPAGPTTTPELS